MAKNDNWITPNGSADPVPACVTFDDDVDNVGVDQQESGDHPTGSGTDHTQSTPYAGLLTPETRADTLQKQPFVSAESPPLPAFIAPLSRCILSEDIEFLERKGALTVPEPELQVEILRAYLFSVHPFMPMLDYRSFAHVVLNNRGDGRLSLLLFQAVMFAGLHSLPLPIIQRLGFDSAKQARGVFFNRVRLLYEFDVEPDIAAVLQSLILMSSWYSKWDGRRDTWHWTGLAYDVARRMGLHREPTARHASDKARKFRRRLFWSLYIRDRMIALGTRRPMRVQDGDCDVSMLSLEDFDLEPFDEIHHDQPLVPNAKESRATALQCIELAKLCVCIGKVVSSQYAMIRTQPDQDIPHTVMVVSRRDKKSADELEARERELKEWFDALDTNVHRSSSIGSIDGTHSCAEVHWAILNLTYQTTINVLHRAQALKPLHEAADGRTVQERSRTKVKDSARTLTKLSQSLLHNDEARFLGLIGVTALIAAYLSHILDVSSADEDVRDASTFRLHQTFEVLSSMRQIYASADAAVTFLASVSRKAGVSVPANTIESTPGLANGIAMPSPGGRLANGWEEKSGLLNSQSSAHLPEWPVNGGRAAIQPLGSHSLQPRLGSEGQLLTSSSMMHADPNTDSFLPPISTTAMPSPSLNSTLLNTRTRAYNSPQFVDTTLGSLSNSAAHGNLFDWDGSMEFGMDIEPMSFSHDFYSDAFGWGDSHFQGV